MQIGCHSSDKGQVPSPLHMHFKIFRVDFHFYHGLLTQKYVRSQENLLGTSEDFQPMNDPNWNFLTPVYSPLTETHQVRQTHPSSFPFFSAISTLLPFLRNSQGWRMHNHLEANGGPQYTVRGRGLHKLNSKSSFQRQFLSALPTFPKWTFHC